MGGARVAAKSVLAALPRTGTLAGRLDTLVTVVGTTPKDCCGAEIRFLNHARVKQRQQPKCHFLGVFGLTIYRRRAARIIKNSIEHRHVGRAKRSPVVWMRWRHCQ